MPYETATTTRLGDRDCNQDRCAVVQREDAILLLLADGMGGHPRGELAAQVFIDSLAAQFDDTPLPIDDPQRFLGQAFARAHADIIAAGDREQPPARPLTTGVACLLQDGHAWWAHAGDSRLYLIRNGELLARTRDHSMVEELIQGGEVLESERAQHPWRNIVTRALGGKPEPPAITHAEPVRAIPGDVILLCSDGLWAAVPEERLSGLSAAAQLEPATRQLAADAEASSHPWSDNVTLVVLRIANDS